MFEQKYLHPTGFKGILPLLLYRVYVAPGNSEKENLLFFDRNLKWLY